MLGSGVTEYLSDGYGEHNVFDNFFDRREDTILR